jgi:glycine/D-amino acid oxidase-like deaminating enzyme
MSGVKFDHIVVGGGIFGCYAALYLAGKGARVALLEKEARLFQKASLVNQARLHSGYHYPRSIATAALSDEHKARFTAEHRQFVNFTFEQFYAVDRFGSFTDPKQFERFCEYLAIRCERVDDHPLFNYDRLEALYRTEEYSFDPVLLGVYYRSQVERHPNIAVLKNVALESACADGTDWVIEFSQPDHPGRTVIESPTVINATYAATNAVNRLFAVDDLHLTHEISEIAFITSPQFGNRGLTVMDGPFGSIMPYGQSGLLSLSSVAYTHHKISYDNLPRFDCQVPEDPSCRPEAPGICTECPRRPVSNAGKMLAQMTRYFTDSVHFEHLFSYYTIKSKLKASFIDDSRPTEISQLRQTPRFYCLFAGKINSIYEVEKIV